MIKIKVPATSANIGPGFDCLGLALDLYANFEVDRNNEYEMVGFESVKNIFLDAYQYTCNVKKWDEVPIKCKMISDIPMARGLGSSAALIVGGIACAMIIHTNKLDKEELIYLSNQMEGHPDNVVPAIIGGLCASKLYGKNVEVIQYNIHERYQFSLLIPDFVLSTEYSRNILPKMIDRSIASYNLSQIPFLLDGLINGDARRLKHALVDKLHQDIRFTLNTDFSVICDQLNKLNRMYYLSGAGPSIMIIHDGVDKIILNFDKTKSKWSLIPVKIDLKGIVWSYES